MGQEKPQPVRVVVWDERQEDQKQAYDGGYLGEAIAKHLESQGGFLVRSQSLDDAKQGLDDTVLDFAEVIIWWGHTRHSKITPEMGKKITKRITDGRLSLIALHSSHFATPFFEAMNEKTRRDAVEKYSAPSTKVTVSDIPLRTRYYLPKLTEPRTPRVLPHKFPNGRVTLDVYLPNCCFPSYRADGKPSHVFVIKPKHPIAAGLPTRFQLPKTEMYNEPFQVPEPDEVIFEERWPTGEWFRSGMVWNLGHGKVFYFRPGHETYPIFRQAEPLKIMTNATRWLAEEQRKTQE